MQVEVHLQLGQRRYMLKVFTDAQASASGTSRGLLPHGLYLEGYYTLPSSLRPIAGAHRPILVIKALHRDTFRFSKGKFFARNP